MAAPAFGPRPFAFLRPGQRHVPPLAGNAVGAFDQMAIEGDAAAATGADDDGEYALGALGRAIERFGQGQAVGVVSQLDRPAERRFHILMKTTPVEIGRIGVAHDAGPRRGRPRRTDADSHVTQRRVLLPGFRLGPPDQVLDQRNGRVVIAGVRLAVARQELAIGGQRRRFDLRAAEIDANIKHPNVHILNSDRGGPAPAPTRRSKPAPIGFEDILVQRAPKRRDGTIKPY